MVLARALVVKAAPVLWIVRRFLPLSAGVEGSAPGSPYLLSYHHLGLICAASLAAARVSMQSILKFDGV